MTVTEQSPQAERRERELARRENRATHPPLPDKFDTQIIGVTFNPTYPAGLNDLREYLAVPFDERGTVWLSLDREPDNEYDPNAIAVCWGLLKIGHLNRVIAMRLAPELDAGATWLCRAVAVEGDQDQPGCTIRCKREGSDQ